LNVCSWFMAEGARRAKDAISAIFILGLMARFA
jgi:hypothetical protein